MQVPFRFEVDDRARTRTGAALTGNATFPSAGTITRSNAAGPRVVDAR
jgi:hypothetical protein